MDPTREILPEETVAIPLPSSRRSTVSRPLLTDSSTAEEGRFIPGTLLGGRYRIIGLLGRGGMGEVYRATDLTLGQSVALKLLPEAAAEDEHLLERFHGEVRVARQVSHPNVCRVYDIGEAEGLPFISMEYVDGEDLSSLLRRIGRLPSDRALETARGICAGLAAAHSKGVIHRDLKPQNIMMNKRGEIMIMDFGLAALTDQLSGGEARNGTPAYMSPEQLKGTDVTAKSDIYSLGLVLYELFTGRRPFESSSVQGLIERQESAQITSMSSISADIDPAVEKAIRRCLDPDPNRRPATALLVSAALPGGDPLAAALAAGQTPSPEMVASAGTTEGMALRYALPCVAIVLICIFAAGFIKQRTTAFFQAALDYPPDVLRQKARDIAANFGYTRKPLDADLWLEQRLNVLNYMNRLPSPDWQGWLAAEAPIAAAYRESPEFLVAQPDGHVSLENPPPLKPGMTHMTLDGEGRLRGFGGVPYADGGQPAQPVDAEAVFQAAQLRMTDFHEVTPATVPASASDRFRAWRGKHPALPNTPLTLEAAWWKGRITYVKIVWPWMKEAGWESSDLSAISGLRDILSPVLEVAGFLFACVFARRNWKLGRGDRRGALRVGIAGFVLGQLSWFGEVHAVPRGAMISLLFQAVSDTLFASAVLMLLYLALEPEVRSRWPRSIVTWSRLLSGRWHDAQVGAHVLIGAAVGVALWTATGLRECLVPQLRMTVGGLYLLDGPRHWASGMLDRANEGMTSGLVIFFGIFLLRTLLRKDWAAAIVGALVFASLEGDLSHSLDWKTDYLIYALLFSVLIFVLLRFGMLASVSAVFFLNMLNGITLGTDWSTWYAPTGIATMTLACGIALFAFKQALGAARTPVSLA